ncbi:MAG: hypothetical protein QXO76_10610, partial [Thermoproteota archaeon]
NWNNAEALRSAAIKLRGKYGNDWERNMAFKLASALKTLLNGGSLSEYHEALGLRTPRFKRIGLSA